MKEEKWTIPTEDGHLIYGVTNYAGDAPSDKCIVIVHGLTGHMNEYLPNVAARYFITKGYDVLRFNLYDWQDKGRNLRDCTLQTHAEDLRTVLESKTESCGKVFLIGHSYGGPTIMTAQPNKIAALSLWDPTFDLTRVWSNLKEEAGLLLINGGCDVVISRAMHEEAMGYTEEKCLSLSKQYNVPIQVITAGDKDAFYVNDKHSYHSAGHPLNERKIVDGADHCFNNGNTCDTLLEYTYEWFERF